MGCPAIGCRNGVPRVPRTWGPSVLLTNRGRSTNHLESAAHRPHFNAVSPQQLHSRDASRRCDQLAQSGPPSGVPEGQQDISPGLQSWVGGLKMTPEPRRGGANSSTLAQRAGSVHEERSEGSAVAFSGPIRVTSGSPTTRALAMTRHKLSRRCLSSSIEQAGLLGANHHAQTLPAFRGRLSSC
jgi:hypothetical protein